MYARVGCMYRQIGVGFKGRGCVGGAYLEYRDIKVSILMTVNHCTTCL